MKCICASLAKLDAGWWLILNNFFIEEARECSFISVTFLFGLELYHNSWYWCYKLRYWIWSVEQIGLNIWLKLSASETRTWTWGYVIPFIFALFSRIQSSLGAGLFFCMHPIHFPRKHHILLLYTPRSALSWIQLSYILCAQWLSISLQIGLSWFWIGSAEA